MRDLVRIQRESVRACAARVDFQAYQIARVVFRRLASGGQEVKWWQQGELRCHVHVQGSRGVVVAVPCNGSRIELGPIVTLSSFAGQLQPTSLKHRALEDCQPTQHWQRQSSASKTPIESPAAYP
jgi:predicted metal-binding membrane protein